ncbi:MAG: ferrous iron transport protein A [Hyphomicrobiaceae bacterium]|nr:ferrous iron transport protein A [Hyphomicrobiaceae bacterium]
MAALAPALALGQVRRGFVGIIDGIRTDNANAGIDHAEIERRLLELGFVEGEPVEVLHEGAFGRDPIAVRVHGMTIALRRRDAMAVMVRPAS